MCDREGHDAHNIFTAPVLAEVVAVEAARGSRRRRLWELPSHALCPVIGVCLPMPLLRKCLAKALGGRVLAGDYELHCGVISDCGRRTPIAQQLQRLLDQRYAAALRVAAQQKTGDALLRWWSAARPGAEVPGALWATLSHARCDSELQDRVLRDIHMVQHQVGSAERADLRRLGALENENRALNEELARSRNRCQHLTQQRALEVEMFQADKVRLRIELVRRGAELEGLRATLRRLQAAVPELRRRQELATQVGDQQSRIHALEHALLAARQDLAHARRHGEEARPAPADADPARAPADEAEPVLPALGERSVLCVGGRPSAVPVYRQLIERTGGRFLHHDGGQEDAVAKLDVNLAAADLVICQTGCISHHAYWRVKEHCKRTGKRCVFVDKPSVSSLHKALTDLLPPTARP
ncbi:MAG: DUF2325 domain-containing protein [Proteobacteria bacterium]|nr:DUF2325 domain-containing protein [Pseudomonadota bacterium]